MSGNNHNGFQIHEYDSPVREFHLVEGDRKGQSAGERHVRYSPVSNTTHPLRTYPFTLQDMSHNTDFPGLKGARTTNLNSNILVYMA